MTLNAITHSYFEILVFFSVYHEYLNKDTRTIADENTGAHIITAVEVLYGYHDGSVETGCQRQWGYRK